ncbi:SDR family oxidoreductase [Streptomyces sp. NPDC005774]|uniref:SDR family oxidoreductase n=1 Tax=Streptomyces TaxID=1883 RepID=UPI0033D646B8
MSLLANHVVLLSGGGSGMGRGVARHFLSEGAQLAILEIVPEKVESLKEEFGDEVLVIQGDATKLADLDATKHAVLERFGRIDSYVGCQGVFDGNIPLKDMPVEKIESTFDELFHINVMSYILAARVFVDELEKTEGSIVLTASVAAFMADGGGLFYTATKGAVRSVIGQLGLEFAPKVRVNGIAPAGFAGSELRGPKALALDGQKQSDIPKEAFLNLFQEVSLLQELPTPEDHGPFYALLASKTNKIATGQVFVVDQGALNRPFLSAPHRPTSGGIG